MKNFNSTTSRIFEVDILRGGAIILMVIFHFGYDLAAFGWTSYNTGQDIEWRIFRSMIVSSFLLAVGMSSYLAYQIQIKPKKLVLTETKLVLVSVILTLGSLFMYPESWVYFGIIHFIAVALPISILFRHIPNTALLVGILCIGGYWLDILNFYRIWQWSVLNWGIPEHTTDLVSFFPWIGVVLIGVFIMSHNLFGLTVSQNRLSTKLSFLGKHSLLIYLVHQPILFGLFYLVDITLGRYYL
jgi:uncharacterized membrane protein